MTYALRKCRANAAHDERTPAARDDLIWSCDFDLRAWCTYDVHRSEQRDAGGGEGDCAYGEQYRVGAAAAVGC
jgi:hypothetical protein